MSSAVTFAPASEQPGSRRCRFRRRRRGGPSHRPRRPPSAPHPRRLRSVRRSPRTCLRSTGPWPSAGLRSVRLCSSGFPFPRRWLYGPSRSHRSGRERSLSRRRGRSSAAPAANRTAIQASISAHGGPEPRGRRRRTRRPRGRGPGSRSVGRRRAEAPDLGRECRQRPSTANPKMRMPTIAIGWLRTRRPTPTPRRPAAPRPRRFARTAPAVRRNREWGGRAPRGSRADTPVATRSRPRAGRPAAAKASTFAARNRSRSGAARSELVIVRWRHSPVIPTIARIRMKRLLAYRWCRRR